MPRAKQKPIDEENNDITINLKESSVAEFTKRPVPSQEELEQFDEALEETAGNDNFTDTNDDMEEEIEESLNEIYQDDKGNMVDVKSMDVQKRRGFLYWLMMLIILLGVPAGAAYLGYKYFFLDTGTDATAMEFDITGETEVTAGEEFFYNINYRNLSNVVITDARVEVQYPENFVFLDSFPATTADNKNVWEIPSIPPQLANTIKIKGMMLGGKSDTGVIVANITYMPANFSSQFKKEKALTTVIKDIGLDFSIDYVKTALVGDDNDIKIHFHGKENNFITNFRVTMEPQENIEILNSSNDGIDNPATYTSDLPGVWQVENVTSEDQVLPIKFKFQEKTSDQQTVKLTFEKPGGDGSYRSFHEETLDYEVMKSDLNLALIINGSREDQGINFGDTLNYSIVYNNKGEAALKDVIIMVVLDSDFLDGTTLDDPNKGREKGNTITWTKDEIPALENIDVNQEGTIDFSIKVLQAGQDRLESRLSGKKLRPVQRRQNG